MFNCDTIYSVFIAMTLAVSQGLKPLADLKREYGQMRAL
ncbi:hypothetical protein AVDCRST_MAG84-6602 [uncultured Microcoleus sp.]|uniref:Uncharacterized protein n=1 Tax=uncultured Microcoleus sp. TaxID=259945 RepID=A0A6J4PEE9_9CYAN|nr:hypothetical protein AVDCRST_MAG84-6602 [uncultured Microcoleus sp.]